MESLLAFKEVDLESEEFNLCPCSEKLRKVLHGFHTALLHHANHPLPPADDAGKEEVKEVSWAEKLLAILAAKEEEKGEEQVNTKPGMSLLHAYRNQNML